MYGVFVKLHLLHIAWNEQKTLRSRTSKEIKHLIENVQKVFFRSVAETMPGEINSNIENNHLTFGYQLDKLIR